MYIAPNYKYSINTYNAPKRTSEPHFCGGGINAVSETGMRGVEYSFRVIGNRISDFFAKPYIKNAIGFISGVKPEQTEKYLVLLDEISRFYSSAKKFHVNIQDKILERVAAGGKSTIFIMNHSNQGQDPSMLACLNTLLTDAYIKAGKKEDFPLPKIILNQDILKTMNPVKRKAFEAFGAVGIDANLFSADKSVNARAFFPLIKGFIKDKCNIFIFPEGKMAISQTLDLNERFQSGVAEMVSKILGIKKEVTVVPVGFSYGKGADKEFNAMHIGEPVTFKRTDEGHTTVTAGLIPKSEFADEAFVKFFREHEGEEDVVMTHEKVPIKPEDTVKFIRRLLSENLEICTKEADKKFKIERNNVCEDIEKLKLAGDQWKYFEGLYVKK